MSMISIEDHNEVSAVFKAEIDRLKAENAELLAENKQLKHLADPAREVDIQAVCADVIDRQINHHGYTCTDYCHFCGVRLCYGEAHRHDCSVLIAMDLQTRYCHDKATPH